MPVYAITCETCGSDSEVFSHMAHQPACDVCGSTDTRVDWRRQRAPGLKREWHGTEAVSQTLEFDPSAAGRQTLVEEGCPTLARSLNDEGRPTFTSDTHQRTVYAEMTAAIDRIVTEEAATARGVTS